LEGVCAGLRGLLNFLLLDLGLSHIGMEMFAMIAVGFDVSSTPG
jgi:hypothetical protein